MKVKFILPALVEAKGEHWRSIKYSLFPPLGLALLAAYLDPDDEAEIADEHVQPLDLDDTPDLVAIEVYITAARRAYAIADHYRRRGIPVVMGGLHPTARPGEALRHADSVILGPAEEAWPRFLADFRNGSPKKSYRSGHRSLLNQPHFRRDLIQARNYLVPNSIVVSRGCPHVCNFCYKNDFFAGGESFYLAEVDWAMGEVERMKGRHVYFLDDNILGNPHFAWELFGRMRRLNRVWQGAATVLSLRNRPLLDRAVAAGLRSLFIGFESLSARSLQNHRKPQNKIKEYEQVIRELHRRGVMVNASFVFGMEGDDPGVFDRTVDWAVSMGLETATFHILTPYPGSELFSRYQREGRILTHDWDLYDTRHAVFRHDTLLKEELEEGYWRAYERFYSWEAIARSAWTKATPGAAARHFFYTAAWKKFEWLWRGVITLKRLPLAISLLEKTLDGVSGNSTSLATLKNNAGSFPVQESIGR